MRFHDMNGGDWFWMSGMMIVLVAAVVTIILLGFRRDKLSPPPRTPDEVLHHRLASGEIDLDDFQRRQDALNGARAR